MERNEIILRRLQAQHLLVPADTQTVVKDLCGVQAQFLSHALHGLSIRCGVVSAENLVKSWTIRGTMHLFSADDLPLFLHQGRTHFLRPIDTLDSDAYMGAERKAYFADVIVAAIGEGIGEREALKALCESRGMTESESKSAFDPWGGLIRALCEQGRSSVRPLSPWRRLRRGWSWRAGISQISALPRSKMPLTSLAPPSRR